MSFCKGRVIGIKKLFRVRAKQLCVYVYTEKTDRLERPFCAEGGEGVEAFVDEVGRDFYFATEAEVEVFATFDFVEIDPKLWFGHEYILSALPWARFATEVEIAIKRAPTFGKIDAPNASYLKAMYVGFARKTNYARIDFI